jgi:hypothetical protein
MPIGAAFGSAFLLSLGYLQAHSLYEKGRLLEKSGVNRRLPPKNG